MEFLTGPCPACGKDLQIPAELEAFSCLYCGARLKPNDLLPCPTGSADALLQGLSGCVTPYRDTISHLLPKKYAPRFEAYTAAHGQLLETLDQVSPARFSAIAQALVEGITAWAEQARRPLERKEALLEDARYTLCLLLVPAVQRLAPLRGRAFCETLLTAWLKACPNQPFQLTTYEAIAGGFQKNKLCFITTAVCAYQEKPDDCAELTAFRAFRDGWLSRQPLGVHQRSTYYRIAPAIVTAINVTEPERIYPAIWQAYLRPCYQALQAGQLRRCRKLYTAMVRSLRKRFKL